MKYFKGTFSTVRDARRDSVGTATVFAMQHIQTFNRCIQREEYIPIRWGESSRAI